MRPSSVWRSMRSMRERRSILPEPSGVSSSASKVSSAAMMRQPSRTAAAWTFAAARRRWRRDSSCTSRARGGRGPNCFFARRVQFGQKQALEGILVVEGRMLRQDVQGIVGEGPEIHRVEFAGAVVFGVHPEHMAQIVAEGAGEIGPEGGDGNGRGNLSRVHRPAAQGAGPDGRGRRAARRGGRAAQKGAPRARADRHRGRRAGGAKAVAGPGWRNGGCTGTGRRRRGATPAGRGRGTGRGQTTRGCRRVPRGRGGSRAGRHRRCASRERCLRACRPAGGRARFPTAPRASRWFHAGRRGWAWEKSVRSGARSAAGPTHPRRRVRGGGPIHRWIEGGRPGSGRPRQRADRAGPMARACGSRRDPQGTAAGDR